MRPMFKRLLNAWTSLTKSRGINNEPMAKITKAIGRITGGAARMRSMISSKQTAPWEAEAHDNCAENVLKRKSHRVNQVGSKWSLAQQPFQRSILSRASCAL